MLATIIVLSSLLAAAGPAVPQTPPRPVRVAQADASDRWYGGEYEKCDGSTVEMVDCIMAIRDQWDKRLNAAYGKLMKSLPPESRTELRDVQRKWIAYRDADCRYYGDQPGSIARIEAATCMATLTRDRAQELEMGLEH